jgi:hypothetical protein
MPESQKKRVTHQVKKKVFEKNKIDTIAGITHFKRPTR